ncbi:MAG: hypothetical protein ACR2NN_13230 [Bryobacteraceae bacterium]
MIAAEPPFFTSPVLEPFHPVLGTARKKLSRLLIPSFADCFFLAVLIWLFLAGASGWKALLMDGDTGWHIRTGQYILAHGQIPRQDLFSYSKAGEPWFAWEWLSDVIFAILFAAAGLKGIVLFAGVTIAGVSTILLRYTLWRGTNSLIALGTTLLAIGSSTMHFLARPHLFTLLLLPVSLWLLQRDRAALNQGERDRGVWLLIPLVAIWTNLHGGFVVFLACLALLIVGCAVESRFYPSRRVAVRRYSAVFMGCCSATLLNPYGIQLHVHIWRYLRSDWIRNLVQEFQAPTFRNEGQMQFELLLILGLLTAGCLIRQKRITEALWLIFLAHSSLTSLRHAPLYALVAAPILAIQLAEWWRQETASGPSGSVGRILFQLGEDLRPAFMRTSVWAAVTVLVLAFLNGPVVWPRDFPSEAFPANLIHRNQKILSQGRVFTTDQWGDYLIYSFYPRQKVFIDGRSDFYGEALGRDYLAMLEGSYRALEVLRQQRFDVMLLPVEWPLAEMLKHRPGWNLVEDDGHAILFRADPSVARMPRVLAGS